MLNRCYNHMTPFLLCFLLLVFSVTMCCRSQDIFCPFAKYGSCNYTLINTKSQAFPVVDKYGSKISFR